MLCQFVVQDLILCVQEEVHDSQLCEMVTAWFQMCLEWSFSSRTKTVNALIALHKAGRLDTNCLLKALEEMLSQAEDLLIDIPMTYKYLAELIGTLLQVLLRTRR
ncbi:hypothetical protein B566_EDAN017496 [Ephemera danica]|nr:hypothetical protein B566_EDAN017496 [Ephemera danica]